MQERFQSTHSLRSATSCSESQHLTSPVSIHALLAECDRRFFSISLPSTCFNPRTPCGVRPSKLGNHTSTVTQFQSTHSLRSATELMSNIVGELVVSIHALLAECDFCNFLEFCKFIIVSIHALLAECDSVMQCSCNTSCCFNPRTPCGVRQKRLQTRDKGNYRFNPRTPCGVRPACCLYAGVKEDVSIHALLAECDFIRQIFFQE